MIALTFLPSSRSPEWEVFCYSSLDSDQVRWGEGISGFSSVLVAQTLVAPESHCLPCRRNLHTLKAMHVLVGQIRAPWVSFKLGKQKSEVLASFPLCAVVLIQT